MLLCQPPRGTDPGKLTLVKVSRKLCLQISTSSLGQSQVLPINERTERQTVISEDQREQKCLKPRGLIGRGRADLMGRGLGLGVDAEAALCLADIFQAAFPGTSCSSALHGICNSLLSERVP